MRKIFLILLFAAGCVTLAQTPEIKTDLPTVIPSSPTVANLMKFEEIPVSNYTGVPSISVPIFNTVGKFGLNVDISLSYHPSSIKVDDAASFNGLGWSLIAGGSISRTIRDIPDEAYIPASTFTSKKIGIYHNDGNFIPDKNNYYDVLPLLTPNYSFDRTNEQLNRFLFETNEKQKFDSRHDLYQFNFMGYSGRFIIEKNQNGTFQVVKLDKNNLIINYDATNKTFEIIDTKGFRYVFDVKELSTSQSMNISERINGDISGPNFASNYENFVSAFHLSKVFYENQLVIDYVFNEGYLKEEQIVSNWTRNKPLNPDLQLLINASHNEDHPEIITNGVLPLQTYNYSEVDIKTKKITQIRVIDKAIIDFEIQTGNRNDVNMRQKSLIPYLSKIIIKDWSESIVKEYSFEYLFQHKLFLDRIIEGSQPNQISNYQFKYQYVNEDFADFESDYWGYYKYKNFPECSNFENMNRDVDKVYCEKDVLKQIIYPTGGSVIFDFEPNTYSYEGDNGDTDEFGQVQNFDGNPDNWNITSYDDISLSNANSGSSVGSLNYNLGDFLTTKTLIFNSTILLSNQDSNGYLFLRKRNLTTNEIETVSGINTNGCPVEMIMNEGFNYFIVFSWEVSSDLTQAHIVIEEKTRKLSTQKFLYGGGIRVKDIYYTDNSAPEIINQDFPNSFAKKITYNYNFFTDSSRSSGSLVFPKPKMEYEIVRAFNYLATPYSGHVFSYHEIAYKVFTKSNNLSFISTKGGDVGYKNVTVSQVGNGKTEYTYLSPIDHPEPMNSRSVVYPYAPTPNFDYKRGHLIEERKFDVTNRPLVSTTNQYSFENHVKTTGVTLFYTDLDCVYAGMYPNYDDYRAGYLDPNTYSNGETNEEGFLNVIGSLLNWNVRSCGEYVSDFVTYYLLNEAYGWAKLDSTLTKEYFYNTSGNASIVENNVTFGYNNDNMQLKNKSVVNSNGETIQTEIYYPIDNESISEPIVSELINKNRVEEPLFIRAKKNGAQLSEQKVLYKNWGTNFLAPEIIQSSKGTAPLENRVIYQLMDLENGNPLQLKQEGGTIISYIWGYNKTQPIAKIENATYAQVSSYVSNLQTLSNGTNEAGLISALNAVRTALPNAMITTYTYIPLVGVHTITDPKGDIQTYEYDEFNRLKAVYDKNGNKLSENQYHYRTQN